MGPSSNIEEKGYSTASKGKSSTAGSSEDDKNAWSQSQQKLFEKALASVPKDAADRWTQIARNVPGRTKVSAVRCSSGMGLASPLFIDCS